MLVYDNLVRAHKIIYQPTDTFLRSYTLPVTIRVPKTPICEQSPVVQDSNMQLGFSMHHRLHADSDFDAFAGPSDWRYRGHIPSHLFK